MKEDLIVIPEVEEFKTLVKEAKGELAELDLDDEETHRRDLALDVVEILETKLATVKNMSKLEFKEKIWFASHLYFLETILEDLFEPFEDDMMFFEEEEGEEEEDAK